MGNDVRASFVISQRKWRAFDAHHNFQNFQKFSTFQNFKIFESFENLKTLKLKILKNFENFENFDARLIRVLSRNFFWDFDKWRARVISHKKLVPQIRASFTHDARARQMRVLSRNFFWDVDKWRARVRCAEIRVFYHRPKPCEDMARFGLHKPESMTRQWLHKRRLEVSLLYLLLPPSDRKIV